MNECYCAGGDDARGSRWIGCRGSAQDSKEVRAKDCVEPGVEARCLMVKDVKSGKLYNVSSKNRGRDRYGSNSPLYRRWSNLLHAGHRRAGDQVGSQGWLKCSRGRNPGNKAGRNALTIFSRRLDRKRQLHVRAVQRLPE